MIFEYKQYKITIEDNGRSFTCRAFKDGKEFKAAYCSKKNVDEKGALYSFLRSFLSKKAADIFMDNVVNQSKEIHTQIEVDLFCEKIGLKNNSEYDMIN